MQNPNHVFTFLDPYKLQVINTWVQWQAFGYAISYGLCMCALLYGSPRLKSPFEWSPLRWIGMISYSLYMWHLPFLFLFINFIVYNLRSHGFPHSLEYFAFCCWTIFLVFPLSLTFYRWIEMPGIRLGEFLIKMMANRKKGQGQVANTEKTVPTEAQTQESVVAGA